MGKMVEITLPVEPEAAEKLKDDDKRVLMGRVVSRMLEPSPRELADELAKLFAESQAAAREAGLTDEMIEEELAAYKAERRARRSAG
jgi:hypothetical protein